MAKRDHAKGSLPYRFIAIPMDIIRSSEWNALPPNAVKLAIDLMSQYTGKNNGRLCPSFTVMKECGWKSSKTLVDAKRALLECSFVVLSRKGHPPSTAEWLAFTWWKLDYEKSMDVDPRHFPYLNFVKLVKADLNINVENPLKKLNPVVQKLNRWVPKLASTCSETEPMNLVS
ncbi:MAG: hypothetical protein WBD81_15660 [Collimonas pratensis]|uniref:hypothetical protein n=1 Tax=Collimonas pratensis TaxID=279113 RepID=UPI003C76CEAA